MALAPLFVINYPTLLAKLRLSPIAEETPPQDVTAIVDEAILNARMRLTARLGFTLINNILATTYTDTPTNDAEYLRTLAATTEVRMVRVELICTLPQAYMDASGDLLKRWNVEAPFREMGVSDQEACRLAQEDQIEKALDILDGTTTKDKESDVNTWNGTPDIPTPTIGDSLNRQLIFDDGLFIIVEDPQNL